ncbi:hypothetical protein [Myroides sp.]|uniref:hypothetical protein n=1 Tax=Myroides sp. TaxID=1874736 RepID=UPI003F3AE3AB
MRNKIIVLIVILICGLSWAQQARRFPYLLSLTGDSKPSQITEYFDKPELANSSEHYSKDGLALTYKVGDKRQEFSGFALDEIPFTSEFGIIVEFKYAMIDGIEFNGRYGDGMTFFLYDASKKFEVGSRGASLGYVYRNNKNGNGEPGLNGAYLGVGLDVYGDFKKRDTGDWEKREGISYNWPRNKEHVTVRGGQFGENRYKGYPVLYTINAEKTWTTNRARLDYDTGDYNYHEEQFYKNFEMYTDEDHRGINYNTVIVTVIPANTEGGSYVEVKVKDQHGEKEVIPKFFYPNEFKTRDESGNLYNFKTKIPNNFKVGFAAGTGGAYQKHLVKDVRVSLPYEPETEDIVERMCIGNTTGKSINFKPYAPVYFYNGPVSDPRAGDDKNYIDFSSFQFEDEDGYTLSSRNHHEYTDSGVGKWQYDSNSGGVTFTASSNLSEGEYSVYYSAKGLNDGKWGKGPFGEEVYRSRPTKLTVVVGKCKTMINPTFPVHIKVK